MLIDYNEKYNVSMMKVKNDSIADKFHVPTKGHESLFILDLIIHKLVNFTALNPSGKTDFDETCIKWLVKEARILFKREACLIELTAPVKICGDFHGQYQDML